MNIQLLAKKFYDHSSYIRGYTNETIRRYRQTINFFSKWADIQEIEEVTEQNTKEFFLNGRVNRGWTTGTYITYHKSLLVFFRWCVDNKYIESNPIELIETPRLEKRLPPKLTKKQVIKLLEVIENYPYEYKFLRYRNHAIFSTFVFAGLRKKELINLKYTDVDIENMTIFVRQGKGSKDRIIPMNFTLAEILTKYIAERKRLKRTCPEFFTSLARNGGFTENGLKHLMRKLVVAVGFNFTIHKLRHTFATLMIEGGCDIYSLSRMMGHSDIKTTTIYLSASAEHLRDQVGKHPLS